VVLDILDHPNFTPVFLAEFTAPAQPRHRNRAHAGGMSDETSTEPVAEEPQAAPSEPTATKPRFRDRFQRVGADGSSRTFGLAALIASTLAGVIVGGLGGTALHAAVDDDGPDNGVFRHGPGPWDRGGEERGEHFGGRR